MTLQQGFKKRQIQYLGIYAMLFWFNLGNMAMITAFAIKGLHISKVGLSGIVGMAFAVEFLTDLPASVIADRLGRKILLVIAPLVGATGVGLIAISHSFLAMMAGATLSLGSISALQGVIEPWLKELCGSSANFMIRKRKYDLVKGIGPIGGPLIGGLLAGAFGARVSFACAMIPLLAASATATLLIKEYYPPLVWPPVEENHQASVTTLRIRLRKSGEDQFFVPTSL